jgi:hypothetical protein
MSVMPHVLLSVILSAVAANAVAAAPTTAQFDQARVNGLAWLVTHQSGDGSWKSSNGLAIQSTVAAFDALTNAGIKQGYAYAASEAWLANADGVSVDSLSRKIMALFHAGANVSSLTTKLLTQRNDFARGSWGAYPKYQPTFPDSALATDVFLVSGTAYSDLNYSLGFISSKQNGDGGWPYSASAPTAPVSSLIPTAYSVLTFAHAKAAGWGVDSNLTNGVNWLVAKAKPDGGFADDALATTGSPLETALVYLALNQAKAAGNAAAVAAQATLDNASTFLVNNQAADGSWGNDPFATALGLQILPTLAPGTLADSNKNGVPDVVESKLGWTPTIPNHALAPGNGQSIVGVTTSKLLSNATEYEPFSINLAASGTAPYTWQITSGFLPDGLSLNATTGQISGTPTSLGTFNFSYTVQDAASASVAVAAQIAVVANDGDVPTLPQWGVIVMAALLMGTMAATQRKKRN